MVSPKQFVIEVAYALPDQQTLIAVTVEAGCTIEAAIDRSGILERHPEINLSQQKIGIFSKVRQLSDVVNEGDRIEIYRGLTIDPKDARRQRAVDAGQVLRRKHSRRLYNKRQKKRGLQP
jgi:putative ubiquitin-RnfH superfamily antitoxin RatB of RatAB toxin-antitoxin module